LPASPHGLDEGFGRPAAVLPAGRFELSLTTFFEAVADLILVALALAALALATLAFVDLALADLAVVFLAFFVAMFIPSDFISCEARFAD
jgi:hypothetical protein